MKRATSQYRATQDRVRTVHRFLAKQRRSLLKEGMTMAEVQHLQGPMQSFYAQFEWDLAQYDRLRGGGTIEAVGLDQLGRFLVTLRIASEISQRELAKRLGVHESQVSRDEINDYAGITVERAARLLEALGGELTCQVKLRSKAEDRSKDAKRRARVAS